MRKCGAPREPVKTFTQSEETIEHKEDGAETNENKGVNLDHEDKEETSNS